MNSDWYPGIKAFCDYWPNTPTLLHSLEALEREFDAGNDACIDAAKAIVECACRIILLNLDDPSSPQTPKETLPTFGALTSAAVRVLKLGDVRDEAFKKLVSQHYKLTDALGELRNKGGTLSHGRDGYIETLSKHHQRAAILAADAIVSFLHEAFLDAEKDIFWSKLPYEHYSKQNDLIDNYIRYGQIDEDGDGNEINILMSNGDNISLIVPPSQLLFFFDREAYKTALVVSAQIDSEENALEDNEPVEESQ